MQNVTTLELDLVSGGLGFAIFSPITITAGNGAAVNAGQLNVNIAGAAAQGGSVGVSQGISIHL